MRSLDAAACSAVDSTGQFAETLDLGVHLRDALWRVDSAGIAPVDAHGGLIVAGMGGSSVGGRLAPAALGAAAAPPDRARDGLRHPGLDRQRDARALLELLRHDRGDARDLRRGQGGRRPAASSPPPAARSPSARAPTACP